MKTKCDRCNRRAYRERSKQSLCKLHYRLTQMRDTSRQRGKVVPMVKQLEAMLERCLRNKMLCDVCGAKMFMTGRKKGRNNVVSLQHDADGTLRLLCFGCNVEHSHWPGDLFYEYRRSGMLFCYSCNEVLPEEMFYRDKCGARCKTCRKKINREMWALYGRQWAKASKEKKRANNKLSATHT